MRPPTWKSLGVVELVRPPLFNLIWWCVVFCRLFTTPLFVIHLYNNILFGYIVGAANKYYNYNLKNNVFQMKQLIHQQICPILGCRIYTPLVNDIDVARFCINQNRIMMLRHLRKPLAGDN